MALSREAYGWLVNSLAVTSVLLVYWFVSEPFQVNAYYAAAQVDEVLHFLRQGEGVASRMDLVPWGMSTWMVAATSWLFNLPAITSVHVLTTVFVMLSFLMMVTIYRQHQVDSWLGYLGFPVLCGFAFMWGNLSLIMGLPFLLILMSQSTRLNEGGGASELAFMCYYLSLACVSFELAWLILPVIVVGACVSSPSGRSFVIRLMSLIPGLLFAIHCFVEVQELSSQSGVVFGFPTQAFHVIAFIHVIPLNESFDLYRLLYPFLLVFGPLLLGYRIKRFEPFMILIPYFVFIQIVAPIEVSPVRYYGNFIFCAIVAMLPLIYRRTERCRDRYVMVFAVAMLMIPVGSYCISSVQYQGSHQGMAEDPNNTSRFNGLYQEGLCDRYVEYSPLPGYPIARAVGSGLYLEGAPVLPKACFSHSEILSRKESPALVWVRRLFE